MQQVVLRDDAAFLQHSMNCSSHPIKKFAVNLALGRLLLLLLLLLRAA
jgi:hypothetical protein